MYETLAFAGREFIPMLLILIRCKLHDGTVRSKSRGYIWRSRSLASLGMWSKSLQSRRISDRSQTHQDRVTSVVNRCADIPVRDNIV